MRIARTWAFGSHAEQSGGAQTGSSHDGGPVPLNTGRKYNVTLSASSLNALNHPNYAAPNGDLSSPYFGQSRSLGGLVVMNHGGGASTYNRKIDIQLRFSF
jgi:hypothetical protein